MAAKDVVIHFIDISIWFSPRKISIKHKLCEFQSKITHHGMNSCIHKLYLYKFSTMLNLMVKIHKRINVHTYFPQIYFLMDIFINVEVPSTHHAK